jgi:O-antigen ligase
LSRAVLGFVAAVAIRAAYRTSQSRAVRVAAVTGVVVSVLLIVALTVGRPHVDLSDPGASSYEFATEQVDRWNFAGDGIKAFADRPLVGHGPGALTASYLYEDYRVHITPLNVAATMGIPAVAALVFLIVALWRNRRRPTPIATWSGLAGLALDGLTLDIDHFRHVWILLGLADAERRPDPRDERGGPAGGTEPR